MVGKIPRPADRGYDRDGQGKAAVNQEAIVATRPGRSSAGLGFRCPAVIGRPCDPAASYRAGLNEA
jgi:hypothetical protein